MIALPGRGRRHARRGGGRRERGRRRFAARDRAALEDAARCSTDGAASASTRCSTTPRSTRTSARRSARTAGICVPLIVRDRADRRHRRARQARRATRASPTRTCGSPRGSRFARRRSPSSSRERVQRDALRRVVEAQELERRRLARELHDETGQALTSILLGLKAVEEAKDAPSSATRPRASCASSSSRRCRTCAASRSSCGRRRSTTSASLPALERLAETFTEQTGIDVDVRGEPRRRAAAGRGRDGALPARAGGADERRQARARATRQHLARAQGQLGVGGDRGRRHRLRPSRRGDGIGLIGMRERVGLLDGRLEIESRARPRHDDRRRGAVCDPRPDRRRPRRRPHRPAPAARRRGGHRGRRRGGQRARRRLRGARR